MAAATEDSKRCLSIVGKNFEVHLEAASRQERDQFIDRFGTWSGAGQPPPFSTARMEQGQRFTLFTRSPDDKSVRLTEVFVAVRTGEDGRQALTAWPVDGDESKPIERIEFKAITVRGVALGCLLL